MWLEPPGMCLKSHPYMIGAFPVLSAVEYHAFTTVFPFGQGELNGKITNPSAPDFVHFLFTTLAFVSDGKSFSVVVATV